jgi:hypothetical protein
VRQIQSVKDKEEKEVHMTDERLKELWEQGVELMTEGYT